MRLQVNTKENVKFSEFYIKIGKRSKSLILLLTVLFFRLGLSALFKNSNCSYHRYGTTLSVGGFFNQVTLFRQLLRQLSNLTNSSKASL